MRHQAILIFAAVFLVQSVQAASAASCTAEVGAAKAKSLVAECIDISPATHPPCNAENACALIIGEIKCGCSMAGDKPPRFCDDYQ